MPPRTVRPSKEINQEVMKAIQLLTGRNSNNIVTLSEIVQLVKINIGSDENDLHVTKVIRKSIYQLRNMGLIGYIGYNQYCCAKCFTMDEDILDSPSPEETDAVSPSIAGSTSMDSVSISGNKTNINKLIEEATIVVHDDKAPILKKIEAIEKVTSEQVESQMPRWLKVCLDKVRRNLDNGGPEKVTESKDVQSNKIGEDLMELPSCSKSSLIKMWSRSTTSKSKFAEEISKNTKPKKQQTPPPAPSNQPTPIGKPDPAHFVPDAKRKTIPESTSSLDPNRKRRNSKDSSGKSLSGDEIEQARKLFHGKKKVEKVNPDVRLPGARQHTLSAKRARIENHDINNPTSNTEVVKTTQSKWFQTFLSRKSKSTEKVNISPVSSEEMNIIPVTVTPYSSTMTLWQDEEFLPSGDNETILDTIVELSETDNKLDCTEEENDKKDDGI